MKLSERLTPPDPDEVQFRAMLMTYTLIVGMVFCLVLWIPLHFLFAFSYVQTVAVFGVSQALLRFPMMIDKFQEAAQKARQTAKEKSEDDS